MKKRLSILLCVCMIGGLLAGCNGGSSGSAAESTSTPTSSAVSSEAEASVSSESEASSEAESNSEGESPSIAGDGAELSFSWWGGDARHEATQKAVKAFEAENPGITVSTNYGAWTGWEDSMSTAFYAGSAPDVNQVNWNWIYDYDNGGDTFVDLSTLSDIIDLTQFNQEALDQCTIDGRLLAIPVAMTGRVFYWNKSTFEKAGIDIPASYDDLLAAGAAFEKLGDDYYPLSMGEYDRTIFMVWALETKYGKPWVENGELQYTAEEIAEGLQMFTDLEEAHVIPTIQKLAGDGAESLDKNPNWIEGRYAGIFEWDSSASKFSDALVDDQEFVVGEYLTGLGDNPGGFTKVSLGFSISASCDNPEEAAKLINFLLNEKDGVLPMGSERGIPLSAAALAVCKENDLLDPVTAEANAKVLSSCLYPLDPKFEDATLKSTDGVYYDATAGVSYGDYTPQEGAEVLIDGINNVLGS